MENVVKSRFHFAKSYQGREQKVQTNACAKESTAISHTLQLLLQLQF